MNESTQPNIHISPTKKRKTHYVNNRDFYNALVAYREKIKVAKDNNKSLPQIPKYIGECIFMIATRLSEKGNFINYPFRQDMISDGVENCLRYLLNFDPDKSTNAFAYFTQTIKNAFIRRIEEEKKKMYYQYKLSERMALIDNLYDKNTDIDYTFIETYEEKLAQKREKIKQKKLTE